MKQTITLVFESGKKIELTEDEYKELEKKFTKVEIVTVPRTDSEPWYPKSPWTTPYFLWATTSTPPPKPEGPPNDVVREVIFGK